MRRTGEAAWIEHGRYAWERNYVVLGRIVSVTRHGRAAERAHARLMAEAGNLCPLVDSGQG